MDLTEVTGFVVAIGGLFGIIFKMWHDHTILAMKVADAVEKNAVANTKLQGSVDNFSKLLIRLVEKPKKR